MIRCRVARARVQAALERELALEERLELELHTARCMSCAEFERRARTLQEWLEGPGDPAPRVPDVDAAARVVLAELARAPVAVTRPRRTRRVLVLAAAALVLATAAVLVRARHGRAPSPAVAVAPEVPDAPDAPAWTAADVQTSVRTALLELFPSAGVDEVKARALFVERTREPARAGWPVRRFVEAELEDADERSALAAVRCLAALGEASSVAALERALVRPELAPEALDALGTLGEPALAALERSLSEPTLAAGCVMQICRIGGARAAAALERAARSAKAGSVPSRAALLDALTTTGPSAVASLLRLAEENERGGGRVEGTLVLARLPLVSDGGAELARLLERERLPFELGYRALAFVQPPEALAWLEQRCADSRERALALEALAGFPGDGPLRAALRLAQAGRVPDADVRALVAGLFERDAERAEAFSHALVADGDARALRAWLELLIEGANPAAARALVPLAFSEALGEDERQWAALAVGELGDADAGELLLAELAARAGTDRRRTAACVLSIHALLGGTGVERLLEPCSSSSRRRVLSALDEDRRADAAVRVYRVARALEGALTELADASGDAANKKEIL